VSRTRPLIVNFQILFGPTRLAIVIKNMTCPFALLGNVWRGVRFADVLPLSPTRDQSVAPALAMLDWSVRRCQATPQSNQNRSCFFFL